MVGEERKLGDDVGTSVLKLSWREMYIAGGVSCALRMSCVWLTVGVPVCFDPTVIVSSI